MAKRGVVFEAVLLTFCPNIGQSEVLCATREVTARLAAIITEPRA
jgi:hypothetical protein